MKAVVLALVFVTLIVVALANFANQVSATITVDDVEQLCGLVGKNSGCSGCVLGTQNLCRWVAENVIVTKRFISEEQIGGNVDYSALTTFYCTSREDAEARVNRGEIDDVSFQCPADPAKEAIIRAMIHRGDGDHVSIAQASGINTTFHTSRLANFPRQPWPVDRTSFWEQGGSFFSTEYVDFFNQQFLDCSALTSVDRFIGGEDGGGANILDCSLMTDEVDSDTDEHTKFCIKTVLAGALSTRCPEYGVAVSGICESFMAKVGNNCYDGHLASLVKATLPGNIQKETFLYGIDVVPDGTPFCITEFAVKPSGELEAAYGLHKSADELDEQSVDLCVD